MRRGRRGSMRWIAGGACRRGVNSYNRRKGSSASKSVGMSETSDGEAEGWAMIMLIVLIGLGIWGIVGIFG